MSDRMADDPGARLWPGSFGERSAPVSRAAGRAGRAIREIGRICVVGTPPLPACGPEARAPDLPSEAERIQLPQTRPASGRSPARENPASGRSACDRSRASAPGRLGWKWTIAVAAELKLLGPCRQRLRHGREPRRGLFESLSLEVDNAPSPVRSPGRREGEHVHVVFLCTVARVQSIGGPTIISRPVAARDRMMGHEGSNSERRTLNFGDRGWA